MAVDAQIPSLVRQSTKESLDKDIVTYSSMMGTHRELDLSALPLAGFRSAFITLLLNVCVVSVSCSSFHTSMYVCDAAFGSAPP